jgi:hypothetical protein
VSATRERDRTRSPAKAPRGPGGASALSPRRRGGAAGGGPGSGLGGGAARYGLLLGVAIAVLLDLFAAQLVYPLRLLTVLLHEGSHALVAVLTGGRVLEIVVRAEESGHTLTAGGVPLLISNAGYLGGLTAGLLLSSAPAASRGPCVVLGALALVALGWIPLFSFGFAYTALVGVALVTLGLRGSHATTRFVLRAIGMFIAADAIRDIVSDFGQGDAASLAQYTHVPAFLWSAAWLLAAVWVLVRAMRRAG